ncbi:MAG: hypothetical protein AAFX78_02690 [Cyanobacteria bacterium J06638_20]
MTLTTESALAKDKRTGKAQMQHRHFATIAAIIASLPKPIRYDVAEHFAFELRETNPKFDIDRFLAACA